MGRRATANAAAFRFFPGCGFSCGFGASSSPVSGFPHTRTKPPHPQPAPHAVPRWRQPQRPVSQQPFSEFALQPHLSTLGALRRVRVQEPPTTRDIADGRWRHFTL